MVALVASLLHAKLPRLLFFASLSSVLWWDPAALNVKRLEFLEQYTLAEPASGGF